MNWDLLGAAALFGRVVAGTPGPANLSLMTMGATVGFRWPVVGFCGAVVGFRGAVVGFREALAGFRGALAGFRRVGFRDSSLASTIIIPTNAACRP